MGKIEPRVFPENDRGIKGTRRTEIITHDSSMIDQNESLQVEFPNLGHDDIIFPGMVNLSFNIELSSMANLKRALASNMGRAIVKKLSRKFDRNVILGVPKKYTSLKSYIFVLRIDKSLNFVSVRQDLNLNFETKVSKIEQK